MYRLQVRVHFDAAHYIRDYQGKCSREHGHRWEVEAVFEGSKLDDRNILIDFGDVKRVLNTLIDSELDHYQLNESLQEPNVTAEYLAKRIFERLRYGMDSLPIGNVWHSHDVELVRVAVWESPDCCVSYDGN